MGCRWEGMVVGGGAVVIEGGTGEVESGGTRG